MQVHTCTKAVWKCPEMPKKHGKVSRIWCDAWKYLEARVAHWRSGKGVSAHNDTGTDGHRTRTPWTQRSDKDGRKTDTNADADMDMWSRVVRYLIVVGFCQ